jgi:hypothetical protein
MSNETKPFATDALALSTLHGDLGARAVAAITGPRE